MNFCDAVGLTNQAICFDVRLQNLREIRKGLHRANREKQSVKIRGICGEKKDSTTKNGIDGKEYTGYKKTRVLVSLWQ